MLRSVTISSMPWICVTLIVSTCLRLIFETDENPKVERTFFGIRTFNKSKMLLNEQARLEKNQN